MNKKTSYNSTYTQVGVQCFFESELLNPSSVLLMKFSAKNPRLRQAANRSEEIPSGLSSNLGFTQARNLREAPSR